MPVNHDTSFLEHLPKNCAVQFLDRVKASSSREAFRFPVGDAWESVTWGEAGDRVRRLAAGLLALGLEREQRVAIASSTRYEWILADLAVMCAGGATTTVYPSTNGEDTAYIVGDSESRIIFAEDQEQLTKLRDHRADLPALEKVVSFDPALADSDWVISLDQLSELGEAHLAANPDAVDTVAQSIEPDQLATLIYTSGTTGKPKGVRTLHRAWVFEGEAIKAQRILTEDDLQFLWLPMAHSFGKVLLSTQLACGFATAIDGRVDKIVDNLGIVKPTFMGAAPRIFEKAHARIVTMTAAEGGAKEKIFKMAFEVGTKFDALKRDGKSVPLLLKLQHGLFDKLVFSKVRDRFGGRVKFFISGSAALNADIAQWFHAAGILILEGYGMTENAAGATVNHPDGYKIGTVGQPFPGSEVRIGADGEVQLKGPHIMAGYHNRPEATAEALTEDGWLRTGDKGELDSDGYLKITGRIKELFKTSGGKYIAPPAIEAKFKAICPYVSQFMVFGAERNFVSALITLDPDSIAGWAAENGKEGTSYTDLVRDEAVLSMVGEYVDTLNAQLNRWETVKKWRLLDHDLTIESGELTPSLKVKRNVVEANNKDLIASFYTGS
ncbi:MULTISPECIES: AMP-dependent synthetase/ligase [unclassified Nocardioides]|uniref:AMP-dependent synthetase/ligase n=1 Tax=unclassified Nocardioides TaxID=2615069 RepID=UPI0006F38EC4|nr:MULTISPECIES: long-chain fatty acid--CoA ligase [unclassified Nocardioides]KRA29447.1 AMP-dependent synthetase [Nocardioides sp. Root614]KRA88378.1 AMP-dependent synthetase [Nocardioides sp. Root682]